jgi:hypothetical protein
MNIPPETTTPTSCPVIEAEFDRKTWTTPPWLFELLDAEFGFSTDLASLTTTALAPAFFAVDHDDPDRCDTLAWTPFEVAMTVVLDAEAQNRPTAVAFANPPYGAKENLAWARFLRAVADQGVTVVAVVPVSTAAKYWQENFMRGEVRLLDRRLSYGHPGDDGSEKRGSADFSSAVIVMRPGDVDLHVRTMATEAGLRAA